MKKILILIATLLLASTLFANDTKSSILYWKDCEFPIKQSDVNKFEKEGYSKEVIGAVGVVYDILDGYFEEIKEDTFWELLEHFKSKDLTDFLHSNYENSFSDILENKHLVDTLSLKKWKYKTDADRIAELNKAIQENAEARQKNAEARQKNAEARQKNSKHGCSLEKGKENAEARQENREVTAILGAQ